MPPVFEDSSEVSSSFFGVATLSVMRGHNMMNCNQIVKLSTVERHCITGSIVMRFFLVLFLGLQSHLTFSQGEDSSSYERDLMVLATLFVGHYANSSQA